MYDKPHIIKSLCLITVTGLFAILVACTSETQPRQESIQKITVQSTIVFEGTITHMGETTVSTVPATPHTAIVRVGKIFKGPDFFKSFINKHVTVLVKDISGLELKSNIVFFTTAWIIGKNIALREVGRVAKYDTDSLISQINAISKREALIPIEANIHDAQMVLTGKVTEVHEFRPDHNNRFLDKYISEHAPQWKLAVIQPANIIKGDHRLEKLEVLFPSSIDVAWKDVPKLSVGQQGIWILKMDDVLKMYAIKKRYDFLPLEYLYQVKSITNRNK